MVDVRALRRCLAIGKFDRKRLGYQARGSVGELRWVDEKLDERFEELKSEEAKHELTKAQYKKAWFREMKEIEEGDRKVGIEILRATESLWEFWGEERYYEEVREIQKKLDSKLNRLVARDRKRFKQVMVSVLEGRFDVS